MNYKYIDPEELRKNFIISEGKGYIIPEFKKQLTQIVNDIIKRYHMSELDRKVISWSSLKDVCKDWSHFNSKKYDNAFPYFTEISKRAIARNYNKSLSKLREEYYWYCTVKQRKEKINKINAESETS